MDVEIGPGAAGHRWTKARNNFVGTCARIRSSSQSWVQRLVSFKICALSVLSFIGSVAEPDAATILAENLALQRLSAGPFHAIPSALLRRGSSCGLKIDVDDIQLMSNAARFRVASRSDVLSAGMARTGAAKDHDGRTLDSCARSWDDMYLHSSTTHFTAASSQLVKRMDSLQSLRDLPFHKMQSGNCSHDTPKWQPLDSASAICSRSKCALGFAHQHRVHLLVKGLCRRANSCKACLTVGALRVACNGLCTAARFRSADENPGCPLGM